MAKLALSDMVTHFKLGILGRVDYEAPAPIPSRYPIVEEGAASEGEPTVVEVSTSGLDPISIMNVDSPTTSKDNNEMAKDIPVVKKTPKISTPLAPEGMCLCWTMVKVLRGRPLLQP